MDNYMTVSKTDIDTFYNKSFFFICKTVGFSNYLPFYTSCMFYETHNIDHSTLKCMSVFFIFLEYKTYG